MAYQELKSSMKLKSNLLKKSAEIQSCSNLRDLISIQKRSRHSLYPEERSLLG